ncbi:nuclear transport factor 2 family protein [Streptomyces sp. NPDC048282]|uniref:nuclear transport factor 2 family protein n=1 Tax=Streptomyces sp. NPDC048282 TaxID=3365528 RepID=UPI0037167EB2
MTGRNALVKRWIDMWLEPDDAVRRKTVEELFAPQAVYSMFNLDPFVGHDAIYKQVTLAHHIYVPRDYTFRSQNNATGHHNLIRFGWVMLFGESGETDMIGSDVLVLDEAGRITADYQFHDKLSSVPYGELPYADELVPGLFTPDEVAAYRKVFDRFRATPPRI